MSILYLIRHGENDFTGKRLAGCQPGVHLNANGKAQAQQLADYLAEIPFTAVYSSPLERAVETAQPLAERCGLPLQLHDGLLEVNFGRWQGLTFSYLRRLPDWKNLYKQTDTFCFPGGESIAAAQQRVAAALDAIDSQHSERDLIACVSHSDSIRLAVTHYLHMPLSGFHQLRVDLVSVTVLVLGKEAAHLAAFNCPPSGLKFSKPR
ncbi:MAG: histidine phosphatase family protein [Anaerolineaceae bacterium]|jgi:probable phosphoglycerate mutase